MRDLAAVIRSAILRGVDLPKAIVKWIDGEDASKELTIKQYDRIAQKDIRLIDITFDGRD